MHGVGIDAGVGRFQKDMSNFGDAVCWPEVDARLAPDDFMDTTGACGECFCWHGILLRQSSWTRSCW